MVDRPYKNVRLLVSLILLVATLTVVNVDVTLSTSHALEERLRRGCAKNSTAVPSVVPVLQNDGSQAQVFNASSSESSVSQSTLSSLPVHQCGYSEYPPPHHHQGLPFIEEVFATDGGKSVYFVALNKGVCLREWKDAQEFHSDGITTHHFVCGFADGTMVQSDPIHVKHPNDMDWSNALIVIRCDIPPQYQEQVRQASPTTTLTVDLYGTQDLEASTPERRSLDIDKSTSYQGLPVCHSEWPAYNGSMIPRVKKDALSLMTKIKLSYCPHEGPCNTPITVDPKLVVAWIEHHRSIGFEHFYIYDNDDEPHGILETILIPYIDAGIVTYVWYPKPDCTIDFDSEFKHVGGRFVTGQVVAATAALRRFEHLTTYMAHFDIDEYTVPPVGVTDMKSLIRDHEDVDFLTLQHTWFSECDGAMLNQTQSNTGLPFDTSLCYRDDPTPRKSIMKTSRVLAFIVHVPYATVDGALASNGYHLDDVMVAHYRGRRARDGENVQFDSELDAMARYRTSLHEKIDEYFDDKLTLSAAKDTV